MRTTRRCNVSGSRGMQESSGVQDNASLKASLQKGTPSGFRAGAALNTIFVIALVTGSICL